MDEQTAHAYRYFKRQGFLPLNKESFPLYKRFEGDSRLQDMTATILTAWSFAYAIHYKIIHGHLCSVYSFKDASVFFTVHRPPDTEPGGLQRVIDTLYDTVLEAGLPFLQISAIEERFLSDYTAVKGYDIKSSYDDDHSEYAYYISDFLELSGERHYYKRKRVKKFLDNQHISFQTMTRKDMYLCSAIETIWCRNQDCPYCMSFTGCEKKAMDVMSGIFDENIHTGLFCCYDDKPVGYAVCEKKSKDVSFLYFGKATIPDLFVYIIYMVAKTKLSDAEYINFHEDMGNKGLRQFKASLNAHELWRKYVCVYTNKQRNCHE
jgi:hypothetical protein